MKLDPARQKLIKRRQITGAGTLRGHEYTRESRAALAQSSDEYLLRGESSGKSWLALARDIFDDDGVRKWIYSALARPEKGRTAAREIKGCPII